MRKNILAKSNVALKTKIALIISGFFFSLFLLEAGMRLGGFVLLSIQGYKNRQVLKQEDVYRIMCLGESTTADAEGHSPYPQQLEKILNERGIGIRFKVINKGMIATNTGVIISELEDNLIKYKPHMVVTMMGINDNSEYLMSFGSTNPSKMTGCIYSLRIFKLGRLIWLKARSEYDALKLEVLKIEGDAKASWLVQEKNFRAQLNEKPDAANLLNRLGDLYYRIGRYKEAEELLNKAVSIEPYNGIHYYRLERTLMAQGKYEQAEGIIAQWREKRLDGGIKMFADLEYLYSRKGKFEQVEQMYLEGINKNPEKEWLYWKLAWWYKDQKRAVEAKKMFEKAIELYRLLAEKHPGDDIYCGMLARLYEGIKDYRKAEEYSTMANNIRLHRYNTFTFRNYQKLKAIVQKKGIQLVCMQYPMRSVQKLRNMLELAQGIIFVDNEMAFKKVVIREGYSAYFTDILGGDFGHCTEKGNRLLAENAAKAILKEVFNK